MEILTPKATRRSTRMRVEIPVSVTSLDRTRPFADKCTVLIVSAQGCGFRSERALQMETPIMISDLPGGCIATARAANFRESRGRQLCASDREQESLALQSFFRQRRSASWAQIASAVTERLPY